MADAHLLVVDDEPHIALVIEHACQTAGYRFSHARSLKEARESLAGGDPIDLLLLDVVLPDGSGLDLLEELRAVDATRDLPVIILTGAGFDMVLEQSGRLGATCVTKPFSPTKLRRLVRQLLNETDEGDE
jgi:DNA-binding response OmpR family regulator